MPQVREQARTQRHDGQAYLSAQEEETGPQARVPVPEEVSRRAEGAEATSPKGSEQATGLTSHRGSWAVSLPEWENDSVASAREPGGRPAALRSSRRIRRVLDHGRRRRGRVAVCVADRHAPERRGSVARVGVMASRKVGTAVERNRAKRVLREAARHLSWQPGVEAVLIARRGCADAGFEAVYEEVASLGTELGILAGNG